MVPPKSRPSNKSQTPEATATPPTLSRSELQRVLDEIDQQSGTGTELLSIVHPAGKSLQQLRTRLQEEHAGAEHIKSDTTRKHVQKALTAAQNIVQRYEETPETGIAIFVGVVDTDLSSYVFDETVLSTPLRDSLYECSSTFNTAPVRRVLDAGDTYGLIVVERGRAVLGTSDGDHVTVCQELSSHVMGKTRAGGQSAQRFARERERQLQEFFTTVAGTAKREFITDNSVTVDGLLIGGTLDTAKRFAGDGFLDHRLQNNVIGTYSVEYATARGLEQLRDVGADAIRTTSEEPVAEVLDVFFTQLANDPEHVTYGPDSVAAAVTYGAVETLLVTEEYAPNRVTTGEWRSETDSNRGSDAPRVSDVQAWCDQVQEYGGDVVSVPASLERGDALSDTFGGVAAVLRFPIGQ